MATSRTLIEKLGGVRVVAAHVNEHWKTVHNWTRPGRRIPASFWFSILEMPEAGRSGISAKDFSTLEVNPEESPAASEAAA
jgi:hypothetical protein